MITAKPFKRKELRAPRVSTDTTTPDSNLGQTEIKPSLNLGQIEQSQIEPKERPYKQLDYKLLTKLVYYTVTGTGGIDSRHCDLLINEFMKRYNYEYRYGCSYNLFAILKELTDKGEIDRVKVGRTYYYYNLKGRVSSI